MTNSFDAQLVITPSRGGKLETLKDERVDRSTDEKGGRLP